MGQKEPIELALKLLDNLKIVRHNEHRYISSDFGFVNSFVKMETTLFSLGQPYRIKEGRIADWPYGGTFRQSVDIQAGRR